MVMTDLTDLNLNWLDNTNNKKTKDIEEIVFKSSYNNKEIKKISATIIKITATIIP